MDSAGVAGCYPGQRPQGTLWLRTRWFPAIDLGYVLPIVSVLLMGGWFAFNGWVTVGHHIKLTAYNRLYFQGAIVVFVFIGF